MARRMGAGTIRLESIRDSGSGGGGQPPEQEARWARNLTGRWRTAALAKKSWEKGRNKMQQLAMELALQKGADGPEQGGCGAGEISLNQCIASAYAVRELERPFLGLYGACSTMAESLTLAALLVEGGAAEKALAVTSLPFLLQRAAVPLSLNYGGVRTPTAQHRYGLRGGLGWKAGEHSHRGSLHWPGGGPGGHRPE